MKYCYKIILAMMWLTMAMFICALLGGCKAKEKIVQNTVRDTVWTVQIIQGSKGDSVVYREKVVVEPHIYNIGDTTIVLMDTTIIHSTERTAKEINNYYSGKGKIVHDTAYIEQKAPKKAKAGGNNVVHVHKWRILVAGILAGLLIAICYIYRKAIFGFIRRLADRHL